MGYLKEEAEVYMYLDSRGPLSTLPPAEVCESLPSCRSLHMERKMRVSLHPLFTLTMRAGSECREVNGISKITALHLVVGQL